MGAAFRSAGNVISFLLEEHRVLWGHMGGVPSGVSLPTLSSFLSGRSDTKLNEWELVRLGGQAAGIACAEALK